MGSLRLYAIGIDEVRDFFSASADTASTLRAIAAARFPSPEPRSPGLLGKLGPLFARPVDAPVIRPDVPSGSDVEALLSGRFVGPERLPAAWTLLEAWVDALAWGHHQVDLDEAEVREFDFDLARAGIPARYDLTGLVTTPLGIAMRPHPGLVAGFTRLSHVVALTDAWQQSLPGLSEAFQPRARALLTWLGRFPDWAEDAPSKERPLPDLVTFFHTA